LRRARKSSRFEIEVFGSRGRKEIIAPLAFMEPMSGPLQDRVSRGSADVWIAGAKLLR
jgi:hypothetical protein